MEEVKETIKEFTPNCEFKKTEMHQVAYINYVEKGFDGLSNEEMKLLFELENAGVINLDEMGA